MITASNLSSPPVYQPPKEQGNQKRKIQRDTRKPPLEKKHTRRTIAEVPKCRNQKGEWKALEQNQLQRYPSLRIRKVNGKL